MAISPTSAPAVLVDGVSKRFRIPREQMHTLKERALHPLRRTTYDELQALRDVSFVVERGEFFGIVGRNGSGKSTLLKCLAGIYAADTGQMYVNGRLSTFIELGVGFNPDLAARDNVVLNAIMMGLSPKLAKERFESIVEFAELQEFTDLKLKNYSSGMHVRLAFSVMIQVDADIMLIDEVLAVGDAAFQQKCYDQFNRMRDEGRTILFVTHDMGAVNRFCHRALLLERGEMVVLDEPRRVADRYLELNFPEEERPAQAAAGDGTSTRASIVEAWFESDDGERRQVFPQAGACSFKALVMFGEMVEDPSFAVAIENEEHRAVFATSSTWTEERTGRFEAGDRVLFSVSFENLLAPGRYYATAQVAERGGGAARLDRRERAASLLVTGARSSGGMVELPHDLSLTRLAAEQPGTVPAAMTTEGSE